MYIQNRRRCGWSFCALCIRIKSSDKNNKFRIVWLFGHTEEAKIVSHTLEHMWCQTSSWIFTWFQCPRGLTLTCLPCLAWKSDVDELCLTLIYRQSLACNENSGQMRKSPICIDKLVIRSCENVASVQAVKKAPGSIWIENDAIKKLMIQGYYQWVLAGQHGNPVSQINMNKSD